MKKNRIVFRADGSSSTGLGHVIRCLSLTELLQPYFDCLFILNETDISVKQMVANACEMLVINTNIVEEPEILRGYLLPTDILVTDGYHFTPSYQTAVKQSVGKLVMIDDKAEIFFNADVVFNHGDISTIPVYQKQSYTKVYHGFPYLILRGEFLKAARKKHTVTDINTVFICMGGSDPYNITLKVITACISRNYIKKIIVVTGSVFSHKQQLAYFLKSNKGTLIEHYENIQAVEMVEYIKSSQLAFSTSSSIALEICCVKTGLICGTIIDNQRAIDHQLIASHCCCSVGDWKELTVEKIGEYIDAMNSAEVINQMIKQQALCIDGKSGERIVNIFKELAK